MAQPLVPAILILIACGAVSAEEAATPAPAAVPAAVAPVNESLTLPPAPALAAAGSVPAASGPSTNTDQTVGDLRMALRRRNYAQAEAYLASLPTDTPGYKDLVKMIAALRDEQHAAYAALGAALKSRHCGELALAAERTATLPDLAAATAQARAYVRMVEGIYDRAITRINSAMAAKDEATARKWLERIPANAALLPPITAVKRAAAAQAIDGLEVTTPR